MDELLQLPVHVAFQPLGEEINAGPENRTNFDRPAEYVIWLSNAPPREGRNKHTHQCETMYLSKFSYPPKSETMLLKIGSCLLLLAS